MRSTKTMRDLSACINKELNAFFDTLHSDVKDGTPVASGRAQRGWKRGNKYKVGERSSQIITRNDVPYAPRLDKGWSRQAPNGMVKPALYKGRYK